MPALKGYRALIVEAAACPEGDARFVEELMRGESGGVLDHLSRRRFFTLARSCARSLNHEPGLRALMVRAYPAPKEAV